MSPGPWWRVGSRHGVDRLASTDRCEANIIREGPPGGAHDVERVAARARHLLQQRQRRDLVRIDDQEEIAGSARWDLAEHLPARGALVRLVPLLPPARPRMALAAIAGGQLARPAAGEVVQDTTSHPTAIRVSGKEGVSRRARVVRHRGPRLHDQPTAHSRCRGLQVHREDRQLVVTCDDALIHGSWRRGGDAAEVSVLRSGLSRCDVIGSDQAGRHPNSTSALPVPLWRGCLKGTTGLVPSETG